jgi:hypothetical protein
MPAPEQTNQPLKGVEIMKVRTTIKAGGISLNHNETLTRDNSPALGLKVRTGVKAGAIATNHNETLVRDESR